MTDIIAMHRRLRAELRRLRTNAGLTQRQVAADLGWSPSKIIRIESGLASIGTTDLRALLDRYDVHDRQVVEDLVTWAGASTRLPFVEYREIMPPDTVRYFLHEASASVIRQFEPQVVPGLLQTEMYTRALLRIHDITGDRADAFVASRRERQGILDRPHPPMLRVIVDESVLLRYVGGPSIMSDQLRHLAQLSRRPGITIQVMPFSTDENPGLRGQFVHLEFPDTQDQDVLYLENGLVRDQTFMDEADVISSYLERFIGMEDQAIRPDEFEQYVARAVAMVTGTNDDSGQ